MQTIKLQIAWAKLSSFLTSSISLIDGGHIVPAQELLPDLKEVKEGFEAELSLLINELNNIPTRAELRDSNKIELKDSKMDGEDDETIDGDDDGVSDGNSSDKTIDGEE